MVLTLLPAIPRSIFLIYICVFLTLIAAIGVLIYITSLLSYWTWDKFCLDFVMTPIIF